jgi:hypothetical protein
MKKKLVSLVNVSLVDVVSVGVQIWDEQAKLVSGASVEAVVLSPEGTLCAREALEEVREGVYHKKVCYLGEDAPPGRYSVSVTVAENSQEQSTDSFVLPAERTLEMHGFRIRIPRTYRIGTRGNRYAENQGDVSVELTSSGANSVLVYRKSGQILLEVEAITPVLTAINRGAYDMGTVVENVQRIQLGGRTALQLSGHWTHHLWGKGPFRAIGVPCGKHCFVVEAAVNGEWSSELFEIMNSFRCVEDQW